MVGGGVAFKQFRKPAGRGRFNLAFGHFPHVQHGHEGGHVVARLPVRL